MGIRLYDSAWVEVEGADAPLLVEKDPRNPAAFNVGQHQYDVDGRPFQLGLAVPRIVRLHNLQSAKDAGLRIHYGGDIMPDTLAGNAVRSTSQRN